MEIMATARFNTNSDLDVILEKEDFVTIFAGPGTIYRVSGKGQIFKVGNIVQGTVPLSGTVDEAAYNLDLAGHVGTAKTDGV